MKRNRNFFVLIFLCAVACNPGEIKIGAAYTLGEVPSGIVAVAARQDPFLNGLSTEMTDLPGHDDLIFDAPNGTGYASGMDGWIWKLDLSAGKASQWVRPPVNPAGMQYANRNKDKILVCASRLGAESYAENSRVGLYEVDIATRDVKPLVLDLPKTEQEGFEKVYTGSGRRSYLLKDLNESNSRPFSLCNDLAVSADGNRIYITEPFERGDAAMGSGAVPEAIGLYPHGKLWLYDRSTESVTLVLSGFTFVDGILLEESPTTGDESVIFSETTKFRIMRAFLSGKNEGTSEILFENLPGLADGLERDENGRIWIGIIKQRSGLVNFIHKNPWTKPFLLSLPRKLLPISKKTGILVLDSRAERPLYYAMHDGSRINDISVAVPFGEKVYFPSFDKTSRGLYSLSLADLPLSE